MRRATGVVLLIIAVLVGALGALWAGMKSAGAEVDYCPEGGCVSGWYVVGVLFGVAVLVAVAGVSVLRGQRGGPRPR
jgi:hypothetical protein